MIAIQITTLSDEWYLCGDLRELLWYHITTTRCKRCGKCIGDRARVAACFVPNAAYCFVCFHKIKWPR